MSYTDKQFYADLHKAKPALDRIVAQAIAEDMETTWFPQFLSMGSTRLRQRRGHWRFVPLGGKR